MEGRVLYYFSGMAIKSNVLFVSYPVRMRGPSNFYSNCSHRIMWRIMWHIIWCIMWRIMWRNMWRIMWRIVWRNMWRNMLCIMLGNTWCNMWCNMWCKLQHVALFQVGNLSGLALTESTLSKYESVDKRLLIDLFPPVEKLDAKNRWVLSGAPLLCDWLYFSTFTWFDRDGSLYRTFTYIWACLEGFMKK